MKKFYQVFGIFDHYSYQGLVKGARLCFRNLYFYFRHGESTSTASQLTSPASQKSKDLNKVLLLLQDLAEGAVGLCIQRNCNVGGMMEIKTRYPYYP